MMNYWANFAKTGNPSLDGSGRWTDTYWPLHTPLKREILTLSTEASSILGGHRVRKCAFWKVSSAIGARQCWVKAAPRLWRPLL